MNQLMTNDIKMTSLDIAEIVSKMHKHVLADIRKEIKDLGEEVGRTIFRPTDRLDSHNRRQPCFEFGKQGAMQLALKYDAKTRYKVIKRIEELENKQTELIKPMSKSELALLQAQNIYEIEQRVEKQDKKLTLIESKVDEQITLSYGEQRLLQKAVARRVYEIYETKEERPQAFSSLYREIKDRFGVASYKDVRRQDLQSAINYVANWIPRRVAI